MRRLLLQRLLLLLQLLLLQLRLILPSLTRHKSFHHAACLVMGRANR